MPSSQHHSCDFALVAPPTRNKPAQLGALLQDCHPAEELIFVVVPIMPPV
jgi:hypothetical protein